MTKSSALCVGFLALVCSTLVSFNAQAETEAYPKGPRPEMTTGSLCSRPDTHRYPEHIAYCNRDVESDLKREIIREYDARFGYRIQKMDRQKFKIDHYIPLCAGGSNEKRNLWPQHVSVYSMTDMLEQLVCEKMAQGKLKQSEAVDLIKEAKNNLDRAEEITDRVRSM